MDYMVHGILQARMLEWGVFPFSRGSSQPRDQTQASLTDSLLAEPQGKPKSTGVDSLSLLQGIFLTQESNRGLLHCRWILYQLSYEGSPIQLWRMRYIYPAAAAAAVASVVSDSVRPHRQQLTRLPCPWDSPGKNTGAGCHFLLQCMKVKSEREVAQSCPTLSDPMDCSPPGSSIHGIFQARALEWGAIAFSNV